MGAIAAAVLLLLPLARATAAERHEIHIESQPIATALRTLAAQTGLQVLVLSEDAAEKTAPEIRGNLTNDEALARILHDSGLTYQKIDENTVAIRPAKTTAPVAALAESGMLRLAQAETAPAPGPAPSGYATEAEAPLDEIVVTSTKLGAQRLQDVPMSITAIGEQQIYRAGMTSFVDYARRVPGLGFQSLSAAGSRDDIRGGRRLNLRGVESGHDGVPTVAYYIDDAPIPVMDPKLFDIERIEVLRGPQGTLYGANSMGGTIRLVLNKPRQNEFDYRGDVGLSSVSQGEESYSTNQMVNIPLIEDKLALRAVGYYRFEGGYIDNVLAQNPAGTRILKRDINDEKSWGTRVAAEFRPFEGFSITPSLFRQKTHITNGNQYTSSFSDLAVFNKRVQSPENNDFTLYATELRWTRGNWEVFSATAHFESDFDSVEDRTDSYYQGGFATADEIARNLQTISSERLTEEFRVSYKGARFGGVIGAYYLDEDRFFKQDFPRTYGDRSEPDFFYGTQANGEKHLAFFGEGHLDFTERLSVTGGLRWFRGKQSQDARYYNSGVLDPKPVIRSSASAVSPKLQVSYKPAEDRMVYASATRGFRPGGPNSAVPLNALDCPEALARLGLTEAPAQYEPDTLWSYEIGSKLSFRHRGSVNLAAYRIDWKDVQQTVFLGTFGSDCGFTFVGNIGKAKSEGLEAELSFNASDRLNLTGSLGYTDAKFTASNPAVGIAAGDRLPLVPKLTAAASVQYGFPTFGGREGYLYADVSYRDRSLDSLSEFDLDPFTTVNVRVGTQLLEKVELVLFVDNLFDERGQLSIVRYPPVGPLPPELLEQTITNRPRTYGLSLRYGF